jgi:hypothetical protein
MHISSFSNVFSFLCPHFSLESLLDEITLVQFLEALFKAKYHESALGLAFIYRQKMLMQASDTFPGFQQGQKL